VSEPSPGRQQPRLLLSAALACGAEVDLLLEQIADGRGADLNAHQRLCVPCQAAITEFTAIWKPVAELAIMPVPAPPSLTDAVMSHIRVLVRDV
jgi:hypothetical protein